jgi:hypothetical protein
MMQIQQGYIIAYFAFDIGYEVSLQEASTLLAASPQPPLSRKKQNPAYLQFSTPPQVFRWGVAPPLDGQEGTIQITLYDFGAVSLAFRWPIPPHATLADMPALSSTVYQIDLEATAYAQVRLFSDLIKPAIIRPYLSPLVEDYYVFVLERLEESMTAHQLMSDAANVLAQILRFDTQSLSAEQQREALAQHISYYPTDLALIDWNAALIFDVDYEDALNVLELLNVELLEARYLDAQLDRRISDYERLRQRRRELLLPLQNPYRRPIEELAELRIESSLLAERVHNALNLFGDLYLARIHNAAAQRFSLQAWEDAIDRKLNIAAELYQLLTDRIGVAQGQTLELVVILLILIEIVMAAIPR